MIHTTTPHTILSNQPTITTPGRPPTRSSIRAVSAHIYCIAIGGGEGGGYCTFNVGGASVGARDLVLGVVVILAGVEGQRWRLRECYGGGDGVGRGWTVM